MPEAAEGSVEVAGRVVPGSTVVLVASVASVVPVVPGQSVSLAQGGLVVTVSSLVGWPVGSVG